jgi:hypothetical protein
MATDKRLFIPPDSYLTLNFLKFYKATYFRVYKTFWFSYLVGVPLNLA